MVKEFLMKPKSVDNLDMFQKTMNEYIFELKFDGGSAEIKKHDSSIVITHGKNPTHKNMKYPDLISDILQNIKDGEFIVELCVFDSRGISIFPDYLKRALTDNKIKINFMKDIFPITAVFHDITKHGDDDVTKMPLMDRKKLLNECVKESEHIKISKVFDKPDELLKQKDVIEGIVIKKRYSPYLYSKRDGWFKFRFNTEETVKCNDYEDTETGIVLITEDGRRINCAGEERSEAVKHKLMEGGTIELEIAYHERTMKGYRFTTIKRIVGE